MADVTNMESTLQTINSEYVSLSSEEMAENNIVLDEVLQKLIDGCKETNDLFRRLYRDLFYGGSYYDGLKIQRPDEYDIDIKFDIPYDEPIEPSNKNGFVNLKLKRIRNNNPKLWNRKHHCLRPYYGETGLHALTDFFDDYLDTEKVMLWMHNILSTWLGGKKRNKCRISEIYTESYGWIRVKLRRNGPAFTFRTTGYPDGRIISFDLVPCFVFGEKQWPSAGFRRNPVPKKPEFFIVPKPLLNEHKGTRYFRLSFQEQERVLINDKRSLKPALRLIKKMRDRLRHDDIKSYFIKTVFLWEVYKWRDPSFWNESLSYVFMEVLKRYQRCIQDGEISYFWYPKFNLIGEIDEQTLSDISYELEDVIAHLENNPNDEYLVAKYLCEYQEYQVIGNYSRSPLVAKK